MSHPRGSLPRSGHTPHEHEPRTEAREPGTSTTMAAVTITATSPALPGRTHDAARGRPGGHAVPPTWRRRLAVVAARGRRSVLVMAQAGVALGGSPLAAPERRPAGARTRHDRAARATRCGRSPQRLAPGEDPRPVVDALARGPPRRAAACRARPSSGAGSATTRDRPRRPGILRAGPPWLRLDAAAWRRPDGGTVARCAVRSARPTTTRSSTRARPTTAPRCAAGASAWRAGVASPPTSGSRSSRSWW